MLVRANGEDLDKKFEDLRVKLVDERIMNARRRVEGRDEGCSWMEQNTNY